MACSACKERKVRQTGDNRTRLVEAIPEGDRMEVRYLGGSYSHKIISPNGAIWPFGFSNYGYGQYGDHLVIHKDDFTVKQGGRTLFEEVTIDETPVPMETLTFGNQLIEPIEDETEQEENKTEEELEENIPSAFAELGKK